MSEHLRIAITLVIVLTLASSLAFYVYRRASWAFGLPRSLRRLLAATFVLGVLASALARMLPAAHATVAAPVGATGGAIVLGIILSSVLLVPFELARGLARLWRRLRPRSSEPESEPPSEPASAGDTLLGPERRAFLAQTAAGGAVTLGMGAAAYGALFGRRDYTVETIPIRLEKLPRALDGLTIVQLSDLHVGTYVGERELGAALALVREARADLVVLTGDLLDHDAHYADTLSRFARALSSHSRFGVFAIPGNHDHYAGLSHMMRGLKQAGTEVLLNRHVRVGDQASIVLAGLDDIVGARYGGPGPQLLSAFRGAPDELPRVLLSHNPAFFKQSYGHADLTLSGHTHGGQITMWINPAELVLGHGLVRGHYAVGGSQLYVNRGFGTAGPPVRVGSPPEITRIVLTS